MYNEELNTRRTNEFREFLQNKRLLLVGNAASLFSSNTHGQLIDSFDVVMRFGKGWPDPLDAEYLGTKTDAWFFGPSRAGMAEKFKDVPWKIFTPSQLKLYEDKGAECLIPKSMVDGSFQVYRDFFMTGPSTDIPALNKRVNGVQSDKARLSQGVQAIDWLIHKVKVPNMTLIGFDFFAQQFTYTFDNSRTPQIPNTHHASSWHCPLVSKHYDGNPHAMVAEGSTETNEKKYILSFPQVNHIKMPQVNLEKVDQVLKRMRGTSSEIQR